MSQQIDQFPYRNTGSATHSELFSYLYKKLKILLPLPLCACDSFCNYRILGDYTWPCRTVELPHREDVPAAVQKAVFSSCVKCRKQLGNSICVRKYVQLLICSRKKTKCLVHKHENLNMDPNTSVKIWVISPIYYSRAGGEHRPIPGAH